MIQAQNVVITCGQFLQSIHNIQEKLQHHFDGMFSYQRSTLSTSGWDCKRYELNAKFSPAAAKKLHSFVSHDALSDSYEHNFFRVHVPTPTEMDIVDGATKWASNKHPEGTGKVIHPDLPSCSEVQCVQLILECLDYHRYLRSTLLFRFPEHASLYPKAALYDHAGLLQKLAQKLGLTPRDIQVRPRPFHSPLCHSI